MRYAGILAGGKGTRMGKSDLPKQFLILGTKPVMIHTIEQFLISSSIDRIIVATPADWLNYAKDIITKYIKNTEKIEIVAGGADRNGTIMNICSHIEKTYGIEDDDIIITHDSVRPFITQRIITDNVENCLKYGATDTVIPSYDTIVESLDGENIENIPVRSHYYLGQTPQGFNVKKLMSVYQSLTEEEKKVLTDASKIFVIKGEQVKMVWGEQYNIKITTQYDLKLANAILS